MHLPVSQNVDHAQGHSVRGNGKKDSEYWCVLAAFAYCEESPMRDDSVSRDRMVNKSFDKEGGLSCLKALYLETTEQN